MGALGEAFEAGTCLDAADANGEDVGDFVALVGVEDETAVDGANGDGDGAEESVVAIAALAWN